ncbi:MAG: sulfite exporter TauE/SafE family protein [Saprospiraceae bacterium]|nr:sulfite exporter TauE/SafE family protein [Saprospiraceae bacterium]
MLQTIIPKLYCSNIPSKMFWAAFITGLLGSLHCVGMCGPIALALPYQGQNKWIAVANIILYNFGRVFTYSLIGIFIGLIGKGLFLAGIQAYFSIGLGILLLLIALFAINVEHKILRIPVFGRLNQWVKVNLANLLKQNNPQILFLIGVLNGLLPCGLVYMAVVGAVAMGSIGEGSLYMALFGLGTMPLMLLTAIGGQFIGLKLRNRIKRLLPAFLVAFAILFILRGINFAAPLEMRFWENWNQIPMCH